MGQRQLVKEYAFGLKNRLQLTNQVNRFHDFRRAAGRRFWR
jgi:hypothetical protein